MVDSSNPGAVSAVDGTAAGSVLSRRTVLAGGTMVIAGLVTGCSADDTRSEERTSPRRKPALAPDVAVATAALAEITAVRAAVTGTLNRFPAARSALAEVVAMHRTHEATLADAVPDRAEPSGSAAPAPYVVARGREKALRSLAIREQQLHGTLDGLALRAQSGDFARLLAAMGAAVQQRLAAWPT